MRWRARSTVTAVLAIALGLSIQLGSAGIAGAQVAGSDGGGRIVPVHRTDGKSAGALLGQVWTLIETTPVTQSNPCRRLGRTGHVLVFPGGETCTIERGTPVFVSLGGACNDIVDPTVDPGSYGVDEAAQRKCAVRTSREFLAAVWVSVDGGTAVNIRKPRYAVISPQQHVQLPPDNVYGITPRPEAFVAFGWTALIQNLSLGMHTLQAELVFTDGSSFTAVATVNVTTHHHG